MIKFIHVLVLLFGATAFAEDVPPNMAEGYIVAKKTIQVLNFQSSPKKMDFQGNKPNKSIPFTCIISDNDSEAKEPIEIKKDAKLVFDSEADGTGWNFKHEKSDVSLNIFCRPVKPNGQLYEIDLDAMKFLLSDYLEFHITRKKAKVLE